MIITYHGIESVKITFGEMVLSFNPVSKNSSHKSVRFGADIALVTLNHPDMNGVDQVAHAGKEPFVIQGPGEYEVQGIFVRGYPTTSRYGGTTRINTIYFLRLEGMKICFLGALADADLPAEAKEMSDDINVLFLPIGGEGVLEPSEAHRLAVKLEPHLIIPIHYGAVGRKDALARYLKEEGAEGAQPAEKLTLKRRDLEERKGEVVVLKP